MSGRDPARLREQLGHPIVDCDGHWLEPLLIYSEFLRDEVGPDLTDKYLKARDPGAAWYRADDDERLRRRIRRPVWWPDTNDADYYATSRLPRLLHKRLPEIGIDFAIVYPTRGLSLEGLVGEDFRRGAIRAYNTMSAELFRPYADRLTPVAVIPRRTPEEAIEELTHCVRVLGLKVVLINGAVRRSMPEWKENYVETLGLDARHDYDPLWQTCIDLGVAVTGHGGATTWPDHASVTNYSFNHIGHFAQGNHAYAKSIFLGGVTRRFPRLNFAFLEGGAGWARNLLTDLIGHWEKRTWEAAKKYRRPDRLDLVRVRTLMVQYGDERTKRLLDELMESFRTHETGLSPEELFQREKDHVDDFERLEVTNKRELAQLFAGQFYFGCEADDPMTGLAFDKRMGVSLPALFSSDISHFDVPDMTEVLPEAYELVEKGFLDAADFRAFTFENAVRLHGGMNSRFFEGTTVEQEAAGVLALTPGPVSA